MPILSSFRLKIFFSKVFENIFWIDWFKKNEIWPAYLNIDNSVLHGADVSLILIFS